MTDSRININFRIPGKWDRFVLTACSGSGSVVKTRSIRFADIPPVHLATLQAAMAPIIDLHAPWTGASVSARLGWPMVQPPPDEDGNVPAAYEDTAPVAVELTIYALRDADGAHLVFTSEDYPELRLESEAAVEAFKSFFNH